jgi:hypothetical protein
MGCRVFNSIGRDGKTRGEGGCDEGRGIYSASMSLLPIASGLCGNLSTDRAVKRASAG